MLGTKHFTYSSQQPYEIETSNPRFTAEETEALSGEATCPTRLSWEVVEPKFGLRQPGSSAFNLDLILPHGQSPRGYPSATLFPPPVCEAKRDFLRSTPNLTCCRTSPIPLVGSLLGGGEQLASALSTEGLEPVATPPCP